jgi:hypothetical protein
MTGVRAILLLSACVGAALIPAPQRGVDAFVPVAAHYQPRPIGEVDRARRELEAIQRDGFNSIAIDVRWSTVEPENGKYTFEYLDRLFNLAGESGLRVIVQLHTIDSPPPWLIAQFPDGRYVPEQPDPKPVPNEACLDNTAIRARADSFIRATTDHLSRHRSWYAIDVGSDLTHDFCLCPSSRARFDAWKKTAAVQTRSAFLAQTRADDLKALVTATAPGGIRIVSSHGATPTTSALRDGNRNDWLMASIVDQFGTSARPRDLAALGATGEAMTFDALSSANRGKGWWLVRQGEDGAVDPRLSLWTALSRGANGFLLEPSAYAAAVARVISRNTALFAPLRPRRAKAAILIDPDAPTDVVRLYEALFGANIAADFVRPADLLDGTANRYRIIFLGAPPSSSVGDALRKYVASGGHVAGDSKDALAPARIVELASSAGAPPDVRINAAHGIVETRFLESGQVNMLIGLNHGTTAQRVIMTFTPDTQEAIWQNMVTGTAVNFVAGPDGPTYAHTFAAHDALVLMIRKDIR